MARLGSLTSDSDILTGTSDVNVANFPAVQPVSGAVAVSNLPVIQPVRQVKDTARTAVLLEINNIAAVATEALVSYGGHRGGVALTAGVVAYTVTAGKTFHVQSIVIAAQGTALATLRVRLRALSATVALTSPVYAAGAIVTPANGGGTSEVGLADGVEIPAGFQIGLSVVGAPTQTYSAWVSGYEY
jgi:hypothetical protein